MKWSLFFYSMIGAICWIGLPTCTSSSAEAKPMIELPESANVQKDSLLRFTSGIRSMLQDSQGRYWFGSHQEGVCMFDGTQYTYFDILNGLSDNQVRSIHEDQQGVIWMGTGAGISSYDQDGIHSHLSGGDFQFSSTIMGGKWQLTATDIWLNAGHDSGVYRVDRQQISHVSLPALVELEANPLLGMTGYTKGPTGRLWISFYGGVLGYDGFNFQIIDNTSLGYEAPNYLHVRSILEDSKGRLWIGNNGIGLIVYENGKAIHFSEAQGLIHPESKRSGARSPAGTLEHVFAILEDSQGHLWFGDRDTGVWRYDGEHLKQYPLPTPDPTPMIWSIYEDTKGDLLVGTEGAGVYVLKGTAFVRQF